MDTEWNNNAWNFEFGELLEFEKGPIKRGNETSSSSKGKGKGEGKGKAPVKGQTGWVDQKRYQKYQNRGASKNYKATMCKFYERGACRNGNECTWAHSQSEIDNNS